MGLIISKNRTALKNNWLSEKAGFVALAVMLAACSSCGTKPASAQEGIQVLAFADLEKTKADIYAMTKPGEAENLLDESRLVIHKRLDVSGLEVDDGAGAYFDQRIQVSPGEALRFDIASSATSRATRRLYFFGEDGTLLDSPSVASGDVVFINSNVQYVSAQVFYQDEAHCDKGIRLCRMPGQAWEPDGIGEEFATSLGDDGYENAYLDVSYKDFLEKYWDCHVGKYQGYEVSKVSLGLDAGQQEIYYYVFEPKGYAYTVLLSAGMNACELSPMMGLSSFMKGIMEDESLRPLKRGVRFVVLPVLCPSSFDASPKQYLNQNGVRINKNFDYEGSWESVSADGRGSKGDGPDSEPETQALKAWLHLYGGADLYMDCHADLNNAQDYLFDTVFSDKELWLSAINAQNNMASFYRAKGYVQKDPLIRNWQEPGDVYPKTIYAKEVLGIPSMMIEQWEKSTAYGGDASLQCEGNSIRNYATMIEQYVLYALAGSGH